jgi:glutathione S-transferase/GST-like protein
MEYIDDAFDGPSLRPADPYRRWQMRRVMRYMDNIVAPSLAMLASNRLAAPRFKGADPDELNRELDKIPLPERRAAWEKLMFDKTPAADLEESSRRVAHAFAVFEGWLAEMPWLAGEDFSLADINVVATFWGLPLNYPDQISREATPHLWDWLARCHARPGLQQGFAMSRGFIGERAIEARKLLGVEEAVAA